MNEYDRADVIRLSGTFTDSAGAVADPTTITLRTRDPDGGTAAYTYADSQVLKSGTGIYYMDLTVNTAGHWHYRWEGTGSCAAADEGTFFVTPSNVL